MAKAMKIDFGGVDTEIRKGSGRAAHVPEADYLFKVVKHEVRKTKDGSGKYLSWQVQIVEPKKYKGKTLYHITSLKPEALWNLRNLIFACTGKNVAGKALNFDPAQLYGKIFMGTTEDNEYTTTDDNGREKTTITSRLADTRPREEYEDGEEDDEDTEDDEVDDDDEEVEEVDDEDDEEEVVEVKAKKKKDKKRKEKDEELEEVDLDTI